MDIYTYDKNTVEELREKYFIGKPIVADFHRLHNLLWLWLSEHPGKKKEDWPLWYANMGWIDDRKITYGCFACAVISDNRPQILSCPKCPLDWPARCMESFFGTWKRAMETKDFKRTLPLAVVIAGLSWKGQKEFILQKGEPITAFKPA